MAKATELVIRLKIDGIEDAQKAAELFHAAIKGIAVTVEVSEKKEQA